MVAESVVQRIAAMRLHLLALEDRVRTGLLAGGDVAAELERVRALLEGDPGASALPGASARLARLQNVTAALSEALTPAQVAAVVIDQGVAALGADAGSLAVCSEDRATLEVVRATGYPQELVDRWLSFPIGAPVPMAEAALTGALVLIESPTQRSARYPATGFQHELMQSGSLAAIPLVDDDHAVGVLGLSFAAPRRFDADERTFMLALGRQCAQALLRSRLYEAQREARAGAEAAQRRLRFLAEAGAALTDSLDYERTLEQVARVAVPMLADWCTVYVVTPSGQVERMGLAHVDPAGEEIVGEMRRRFPLASWAPHPVTSVIRSGQPIVAGDVTDDDLLAMTGDPEHAALLRRAGMCSYMCVPLIAHGRTLGSMNFVSAQPGRRYGPEELALAEEIARRAALAADNARLYTEAREALRLRDEFFAAVSHDLKTPLTTIKGLAQLLGRRAARTATPDTAYLVGGLAALDAAPTRMRTLIGQLLDTALLQAGHSFTLDLQAANLAALARRVVEGHHEAVEHVAIHLETPPPAPWGRWDVMRIESVLANLLSNAVKYSPNGGNVAIVVSQEDAAGNSPGWAVLEMRDQGIGIPAADLPHIFDRFFRASNAAGRFSGTGIGLAGVRQIVEQHGGSIGVESTLDEGTTFTLRLPLDAEAEVTGYALLASEP